jgi:drug/metabolite transporter (DMT)-like permease
MKENGIARLAGTRASSRRGQRRPPVTLRKLVTEKDEMNQISSQTNAPLLGALFMLGAGLTFAVINILTPIITYEMGVPSTAVVFWQYVIATVFALPLIARIGLDKLKTRHPYWHEIRAFLSALGVQFFAFGFALGVPVWQMVALSMTGPFFILIGAGLFLREKLTLQRLGATITGFIGAVMVSQIGTEQFTLASLLPVLAAACWGTVSVITKYLSRDEEPESLTLYMLVLITPNHFLIGLLLGIAVAVLPAGALPAGLATGFDFVPPGGDALWLIVLLALVTAAAQYCLSFAYKVADAAYLQPFDDLKLPLNTLLGWIVLSQVPALWFWPGALLILGASSFILWSEHSQKRRDLQPA